MGKNAFAHKGGMHVAGIRQDARTFEHIDPALVGNDRELLISELSGKGTVQARAGETGVELDEAAAARVVDDVKRLESRGYQFEAADGSFDLLIRRSTGDYEPLFTLEAWRVIVEKREDGKVQTEATIKIWVKGERYLRTAEGNGPVNALDSALRSAIGEQFPHLRDIQLVNFKVRILDEKKGTGAVTRVLLDASDGVDTWGAIGVSENVIEASWDALVDSLEAGMLPGRSEHSRGRGAAPRVSRDRVRGGPHPGRAAGDRRPRAAARPGGPRLRSALAGAAPRRVREPLRRAGRRRARIGRVERHRRPPPRRPRCRHRGGRRGRHHPVQLRGLGQLRRLRAGAAGVLRHRPAHPQHRPWGGRRGGVTDRTTGLLPVHIFGYPADMTASRGSPPTAACGS